MSLARRLVPVLLAAGVLAGCEKKTPVPEDRAVLDSYEALLFVPTPDLNALVAHATWLGPDALPPAIKALAGTAQNESKRATLARLLEMLAWNGYRSKESVGALTGLAKDPPFQVRLYAVDALYASGADLSKMDTYWNPGDADESHHVNPTVTMRLPFESCRTRLAQLGVPIPKGADGTVTGDPGKHPEAQPPVKEAAGCLHHWWTKESDPSLRLISAICALRLGDLGAAEPLIAFLAPLPVGAKPSQVGDANRVRSLRALKESTGQSFTAYEDWSKWWDSVKPKPKPTPTFNRPDGSTTQPNTPVKPRNLKPPGHPPETPGNDPK